MDAMKKLMILVGIALLVATSAAEAADYAIVWNDGIENGIEMRVPNFFAGAQAGSNRGVHLVVGDAPLWEECGQVLDQGEIRPDGDDGIFTLEAGALIATPPLYFYFVRDGDHLVHDTHEVNYPGPGGQPVSPESEPSVQPGPPGQPGQPTPVGGTP